MKYGFADSELTSEKSLWSIYRLSKVVRPGRFQVAAVLSVSLALGVDAFVLGADSERVAQDVRSWAVTGFNFSITTLGFLIAGFTVFATLSKPKMMLAMMDHIDKKTGLRTLKLNFFCFMKVFIAYIFFSLLYLIVMLLGQKNGFLSQAISFIPNSVFIKIALVKVSYVVIGGSFVYLLLMLKTFVFNIYTTVMNALRWEYYQD